MKNQNSRRFFCFAVIGLAFMLPLGCGYSFAPKGEYVDNRIQKVYVESFGNKTSRAEIENFARTAFINQFIQHSRFKVVGSKEEADAIIKGTVLNYNATLLSYSNIRLGAEERITAKMEITFLEKESNEVIWSSKSVIGNVDYKLEDNINLIPAARKAALIKLANDMAEKAVNRMMAGF
ncbi:MAG TPA: LPS assembly lipoprotein LptE [Smithellaceae bacterium]|jgi:hypothetical protein|nr:LPS assembly lipoprotein LptE [Smithellaceae bacterium]HNT90443.1 LPS assembly lipoprotein LptE [Smithellaceae bacterium]HNV63713.1 LPS assembly lipoprotein LptE [Smithellaceae bacterium]HNZ31351.1 LPS assembly lipoprotein LptE [Smithellaceae bacterium]HOD30889.1 LPS assembly lipoprotein LptE [Smithellaceae bacterium]